MADAAPLIFERRFSSLVPMNKAAQDAVEASQGRVVVKVTKMTRNQRRRAFYWVMLDVVAEVMSDLTGTPWDAECLHDEVRERLGLGEYLKTPSGKTKFKPRSTSDKAMLEVDRAAWTNRVANYFSKQTGVEVHQLIDEVRNRGGGEPPDQIQRDAA